MKKRRFGRLEVTVGELVRLLQDRDLLAATVKALRDEQARQRAKRLATRRINLEKSERRCAGVQNKHPGEPCKVTGRYQARDGRWFCSIHYGQCPPGWREFPLNAWEIHRLGVEGKTQAELAAIDRERDERIRRENEARWAMEEQAR